MRVIVKGEFSGVIREAFRRRGHDAWSNDLLPAEDGSKFHIIGDGRLIGGEWDLTIWHPTCTFLCNSGVKWLYKGGRKRNGLDTERWNAMRSAADFFLEALEEDTDKLVVENPVMHGHAARLVNVPYTQIIQPWQFGHGEIKKTCLWLRGVKPLIPTNIVSGRKPRVHYASPGPERWKERSRTLQGIGDAMAEQWGE